MLTKPTLCFAAILIASLLISSITAKSLSIEDRRKIAVHCAKTVGIDRKLVGEIIDAQAIPRRGKYGDYLACTYSMQGFIDPVKSVLVPEKIIAFLADYFSSNEVAFIMEGCKNVKNSVPRELVLDALDCYTQQFEITRAMSSAYGNDIYTNDSNPLKQ